MFWMALADRNAVPMNLTPLQVGKRVAKLYQVKGQLLYISIRSSFAWHCPSR